jgi:hypothetical protein
MRKRGRRTHQSARREGEEEEEEGEGEEEQEEWHHAPVLSAGHTSSISSSGQLRLAPAALVVALP